MVAWTVAVLGFPSHFRSSAYSQGLARLVCLAKGRRAHARTARQTTWKLFPIKLGEPLGMCGGELMGL